MKKTVGKPVDESGYCNIVYRNREDNVEYG